MLIACGVEYDGTGFSGWQRQQNANSVQAEVEAALSKVANHPVKLFCAGRTDTGVHATHQVIHFETTAERSEHSWLLGTNTSLPGEISLTWARQMGDDFHARFSAVARSYRYVIFSRKVPGALLRNRVTWTHETLDVARMQAGALHLLGEHDFSSYRATACQAKSPVRTIHRLEVSQQDAFTYLDIEANAFLHHMVRNIAGVLMAVGRAEQEPHWVRDILEQQDRSCGGVTAPPTGLYLVGVRYPQQFGLPEQGLLPVFG
ncbi:tRNA pseudouridine(38-40) synthase [hydrothermal vent metagenome]|uniref:tRNA pseudouridine(38-40) synthase n=1 Tax=hydrothermal vent metagenome TaxID=652676 RepID=A0A3B0YL62_9ZZZZ